MQSLTYLGDLDGMRSGMTVGAAATPDGLLLRWGGPRTGAHERRIACAEIASVRLTTGRRVTQGNQSGIVDFWARWDPASDYLLIHQDDGPALALEGSRDDLAALGADLCRGAAAPPAFQDDAREASQPSASA